MIAVLLVSLFTGTALFAMSAIVMSWQRYGPLALVIGRQLRDCKGTREVRFSITEVNVRQIAPRLNSAKILRPDFRPAARPALRAAA